MKRGFSVGRGVDTGTSGPDRYLLQVTADGVVPPIYVGGQGTIGSTSFDGARSNFAYDPTSNGQKGFHVKLVDSTTTIDNHTVAENALQDDDGDVYTAPYDVIDLAGGAGTFPENQAVSK